MKKERSTRLRWSWLRKIINIAFGLAVFSMVAKPVLAQETVLGPKDLRIGWFGIHSSWHKFTIDELGEGTIIISKNTPEKKIRGGFARLNGKWISIRHFLRGDDLVLDKNVNLRSRNYLFFLLRGARGASISVEVKKKSLSPPPEVNFSANPSAIKLGEASTLNWTTSYTTAVSVEPGIGSVEPSGSQTVTPTETTTYTLTAEGVGGTASKGATVTVYQPPTVTISADPETVIYGESSTLHWSSTDADNVVIDQNIGEVSHEGSLEVKPDRTTTYTITASGPGGTAKTQVVLTVKADVEPQPDGSFGKQYEDLIPLDVTVDAYDPKRFSVVTGLARDPADLPLADVSVTILAQPEYGAASTDNEGRFSIPVEGGGTLTVVYQKEGLIPAQRKVLAPWNDTAIAEAVHMIVEDQAATTLTFDGNPATVVTHESTEVTDEFGSRSATMVFSGDNHAYEVNAQGNVIQELTTITTRATEFTTPESMPAILPQTSAFTYCVELTVDGLERVKFDKPVITWVDNFLGFDVGEIVPVGYYDRDKGVWVPSDNGVVVALLDTDTDGIVDALDSNGDGAPDDLDGDGVLSDEVQGLSDAQRYPPGSTFWRVAVTHFTPWDFNWPMPGPPSGATPPNPKTVFVVDQKIVICEDCERKTSSFVEERSRIFHEDIPIPGTDMALHYASNRVQGYHHRITVPASGDTVPSVLKRIVARVTVAGRTFEEVLPALPNQVAEFVWDGLDYLGRQVNGTVIAKVEIGFVYDAVYYRASSSYERAFAQAGSGPTTVTAREGIVLWKTSALAINQFPEVGKVIAEGWTLSTHHYLSPSDLSILLKGDGSIATNRSRIITTVAGNGTQGYSGDGGPATEAQLSYAFSVDVAPDGSIFVVDSRNYRIRRVDPSGIITTFAGNGQRGYSGDGGPATEARIDSFYFSGISVGPDGSIYFADRLNYRVRRVDPQGIITTVAGNGTQGYSGDGGPATEAQLLVPMNVVVGPDGFLYISDNYRVRRVDPDGIITTVAGNGTIGYSGDGGPALQAQLGGVHEVTFQSDGSYLISNSGSVPFIDNVVRRVGADGIITTVAGMGGWWGYNGDEIPATEAQLGSYNGIASGANGDFYIAEGQENYRVRWVDPEGFIHTIAGTGVKGYSGDGGPAIQAQVDPYDVALGPDGSLYIADSTNRRIRKVSASLVSLNTTTSEEIAFAEESGVGHIFGSAGLHRRTIDLVTEVTLYEFGYDEESRLASITDQFGNQTIINRDSSGVPTSITSPDGITTTLTVDEDNHLTQITYPDGNFYSFEYTPGGLLTAKVEPEGTRFEHGFDSAGRLTDATDEGGGIWQFSRSTDENGDILAEVLTGEGDLTAYLDHYDSTGAFTSTITDPTGAQTLYSISGEGLTVDKSLPCGMELDFEYALDPEYKFKYVKKMEELTPLGLDKVTFRERNYQDNNADDIHDMITETVTVNGKATSLVTNTLQATKTITSPVGRSVTTNYDPVTLVTTSLSIPGLFDTIYGYDTNGRLTSIATNTRQTTFTYNVQGFLESITDPENETTTYSYDAVGRMTGIDRPDTSSVSFTYDNNGNMTVLKNPANITHHFGYNKVNLNSSYQTPVSGSYSYVYDRDRRLTQVNFPSGKQIENIYANGTLEQIQTPEGNIDLTYLCGNKVDTIKKETETITYGYDGALVSAENLSGTLTAGLSHGYDDDFNLTNFTYADGKVNYTYDNDGLLTAAGSFTIGRNAANGLPESVTDGALNLSRAFNGYGEVGGQDFTLGGQGLTSWNLTRDNAGRITAKTETVDGVTSHYIYTYDPMGRLLTVTKDGTLVEKYQYDSVGTRIYEINAPRGIGGRSTTYDDEDHLLTAGDAVYQYDADGYVTTRTVVTETSYEVTSYVYSSRGELLSVTLPDTTLIEYVHDPLGRRIAKKVGGSITEKYLWQGLTRLLAVYDGNGNLLMRFLYADGRMPVAMERGGVIYYLTYDQVGTLRVVADSSGNVVRRIAYDSFGNILSDTNPTFAVPFGFAGGLHDRDTNLVRFGFRDYDPDTGRWTAKDPILFAGGNVDLYGYCLNDPVNWVDSRGLVVEADPYGLGPGAFYGAGAALITTGAMVTRAGAVIIAGGGPVGWIGGAVVTAVGVTMWSTGVWTVYQGTHVGLPVDPQVDSEKYLLSDSFWGAGTACIDY